MSESAAERQGRIVVGVDGSAESGHALRWAARQAGYTGAILEAVVAWQLPAFFGWAPAGGDSADFAAIAGQALSDALNEVFGLEWPDWVRPREVEGYPGQVLVEASEGADLLVVGSRGHAGVADALLGSVSTYCVQHAHVPVTVIRPPGRQHH